jgi:hypothetical protein
MLGHKLGSNAILGVICVLIFIDQQEFETLAKLAANIGTVLQQKGSPHQQVVKVQPVALPEDVLVTEINSRQRSGEKVMGFFLERFGVYELVFEGGNRIEHSGGREIGGIKFAVFNRLLDTSGLVGGVIDAEISLNSGPVGILAKNSYTQRVEGTYMDPGAGSKCKGPLPHLLGGLIGKGYCTNIVRPDA